MLAAICLKDKLKEETMVPKWSNNNNRKITQLHNTHIREHGMRRGSAPWITRQTTEKGSEREREPATKKARRRNDKTRA